MQEFVSHAIKLVDNRTNEEYDTEFDVEWGPLFKLSELDAAERLSRVMQTVSAAINNFILTPSEARSILQEEWADIEIDWKSDFSEEEREWLKTLNVAQMGTEAALPADQSNKIESGNPRVGQNGGGMEQGQQTASEQPTSDGLTDREMDQIAERVAEKLQ
jgi:hypothetical protein